jgi:hypothetical protein
MCYESVGVFSSVVVKMKEDIERKVTHFKYCGEVKTEKVLH